VRLLRGSATLPLLFRHLGREAGIPDEVAFARHGGPGAAHAGARLCGRGARQVRGGRHGLRLRRDAQLGRGAGGKQCLRIFEPMPSAPISTSPMVELPSSKKTWIFPSCVRAYLTQFTSSLVADKLHCCEVQCRHTTVSYAIQPKVMIAQALGVAQHSDDWSSLCPPGW
jgi:hypothetical protein